MNSDRLVMTVREVAGALGISKTHAYELIASEELPALRRSFGISRLALAEFVLVDLDKRKGSPDQISKAWKRATRIPPASSSFKATSPGASFLCTRPSTGAAGPPDTLLQSRNIGSVDLTGKEKTMRLRRVLLVFSP